MKFFRRFSIFFVVASFCLNPAMVLANPVARSSNPALELNSIIPDLSEADLYKGGASLPEAAESIADSREHDANMAPEWVKKIRSRTVGEYFPVMGDGHSSDFQQAKAQLLDDATRLHAYFEQRDQSGLYKDFISKKLAPFVTALTPKTISTVIRNSRITQPVREWTVETLVVTQQLGYLGRLPNFVKNAMGLVSGRHLKGATVAAGMIVVTAVIVYATSEWGFGAGVFLGAALGGARSILGSAGRSFEAGPLAELWKAGTGWVLTPTTEFIRVLNARYFGRAEERVNNFYDRIKPRPSKDPGEARKVIAAAEQNQIPKTASLLEDKTSLAGMTADEQERNWDRCLGIWVAVAKRFGQLLRDTHHHGRYLMMISAHDEQHATILVESIDTKLVTLASQAEAIIELYKLRLSAQAGADDARYRSNLVALESAFDRYQIASERPWREPWLAETTFAQVKVELEKARAELASFGLTERDLMRLDAIQAERGRSVSALVTALATNDLRTFMTAEANRNLDPEARKFTRYVREGFALEQMTQRYLLLVQYRIRQMGFEIGGGQRCTSLFISTASH